MSAGDGDSVVHDDAKQGIGCVFVRALVTAPIFESE